jgi:hypothetical protein
MKVEILASAFSWVLQPLTKLPKMSAPQASSTVTAGNRGRHMGGGQSV